MSLRSGLKFKVFFALLCTLTFTQLQAQRVYLLKSTASTSGGVIFSTQSNVAINQTIGQSSLTNAFSNQKITLLQGFQHPMFSAGTGYTQTNISIYPNPSSGIVYIKTIAEVQSVALKVNLYTTEGKLIKEAIPVKTSPPYSLNFTSLPKGLYLLKVFKKNGTPLHATLLMMQ